MSHHHLKTSITIRTCRGAKSGTVAIVHLQQQRQHMQRHHGCDTRFMHRCHFSCIFDDRLSRHFARERKCLPKLVRQFLKGPKMSQCRLYLLRSLARIHMASASLWRRVDLILVQYAFRLVRPSIKLGEKLIALSLAKSAMAR